MECIFCSCYECVFHFTCCISLLWFCNIECCTTHWFRASHWTDAWMNEWMARYLCLCCKCTVKSSLMTFMGHLCWCLVALCTAERYEQSIISCFFLCTVNSMLSTVLAHGNKDDKIALGSFICFITDWFSFVLKCSYQSFKTISFLFTAVFYSL